MAAAPTPKPTRPVQQLVVRHDRKSSGVSLLLLIPAAFMMPRFTPCWWPRCFS